MKRFIALLLVAALCLCTLLPSAAEEPVASRSPVELTAFQERYEELFAAVFPGNAINWINREIDGQNIWGALMNDALPMLMLLTEDGRIDEIVINFEGPMDEQTTAVFIIQCSLAGGALLMEDGASAQTAFDLAADELAAALAPVLQDGGNKVSVWGAQASYDCFTQDGTNYAFILVLRFNAE